MKNLHMQRFIYISNSNASSKKKKRNLFKQLQTREGCFQIHLMFLSTPVKSKIGIIFYGTAIETGEGEISERILSVKLEH